MKITLFGARGMAGHMISRWLTAQGHDVLALGRADFDIENTPLIDHKLAQLPDADFVINCIGLLVSDSAQCPDRAVLINSWWPRRLERWLRYSRTRLIHLSTDCVFDGTAGPYHETAVPSEINMYGRSKSLGEVDNSKDITMRTSIIGPELGTARGLMEWLCQHPDREVPGWTNVLWNGVTTLQLAQCIERYLHDPCISGVYHVARSDVSITKHDLLCVMNRIFGLGKQIRPHSAPQASNKTLLDTRQQFDFGIADYQVQLEQLRDFYPIAHVRPATS